MSDLFDADAFTDPLATKRGTKRVVDPKQPAKSKDPPPVVKLDKRWRAVAHCGGSPLAHYVLRTNGAGAALLLCGRAGRILEIDAIQFDACERCWRRFRDGHHLSPAIGRTR